MLGARGGGGGLGREHWPQQSLRCVLGRGRFEGEGDGGSRVAATRDVSVCWELGGGGGGGVGGEHWPQRSPRHVYWAEVGLGEREMEAQELRQLET